MEGKITMEAVRMIAEQCLAPEFKDRSDTRRSPTRFKAAARALFAKRCAAGGGGYEDKALTAFLAFLIRYPSALERMRRQAVELGLFGPAKEAENVHASGLHA